MLSHGPKDNILCYLSGPMDARIFAKSDLTREIKGGHTSVFLEGCIQDSMFLER